MSPEAATTFLESTARSSGLSFEPDALKAAAAELAASVERDPTGAFSYTPEGYSTAFRFESGASVEIPAAEHVATLIRRHAKVATPKAQAETPAPTVPPARSTPRDPFAALAQGIAAAEDAKVLREIATWSNPWAKGHENRTRQTVISNRNPALATQFKAQAAI